ncbi:aminodeoxychorismate lyase [Photobacterium sp. ZSDE20]|uniref:Aminodeoxychorismate lyase n=1 Tax=Photobacterium pectinilyticum TaxID=2906793 RepID=A0ABT1MZ43_9GAMM|nr:aminodeoxychorismate lyase [Photobacterium sp. ZSDE20]MCQ1057768.1 aminodeoxychorismate lyase [Photobacterium sp. ZSDE20]MDD1822021.1 aminodeoxychorismate lyase [Photobacterium sp. ZSDE20]
MILINGKPDNQITVTDRAMQYGDGCFTTMLVESGEIRLWPFHLERLKETLSLLDIAEPNWDELATTVSKLATRYPDKGGLKVLISRGSGGRGYSASGCSDTQVVVSEFAWPEHYLQWQQDGITLGVCQQRLSHSPMLAGYKHLNRLEQVLLKREAEQHQWLDAVVLDVVGNVVESIASNIFWRRGNTLYTPSLQLSGVRGVMRRHIFQLVTELDYCLEIVNSTLDCLLCADEVFITNALMALVPVNEINGITFTQQTLLNELNKRLYSC